MIKKTGLMKLYLMVITVPKGKKEVIADTLDRFDVTACLSTLAKGSVERSFNRELIFCVIKEDVIKDAILALEDKFGKFHSNLSMIYTIPLDKMIGVSSYMALSNGGKN